jgi:hypothetical protein
MRSAPLCRHGHRITLWVQSWWASRPDDSDRLADRTPAFADAGPTIGGDSTARGEHSVVNYSTLPRSGLPGPCLLRTELPVSASELAGTDPTAFTRAPLSCGPAEPTVLRTVPDSTGDFPLQVVRSVPLLPDRHSATTDDARFLSSFERPEVFCDDETAKPFRTTFEHRRKRGEHLTTSFDRRGSKDADSHENKRCGRCILSLLASLPEEGGLAPSITAKSTRNPLSNRSQLIGSHYGRKHTKSTLPNAPGSSRGWLRADEMYSLRRSGQWPRRNKPGESSQLRWRYFGTRSSLFDSNALR